MKKRKNESESRRGGKKKAEWEKILSFVPRTWLSTMWVCEKATQSLTKSLSFQCRGKRQTFSSNRRPCLCKGSRLAELYLYRLCKNKQPEFDFRLNAFYACVPRTTMERWKCIWIACRWTMHSSRLLLPPGIMSLTR